MSLSTFITKAKADAAPVVGKIASLGVNTLAWVVFGIGAYEVLKVVYTLVRHFI